jgi:hypothetical protein
MSFSRRTLLTLLAGSGVLSTLGGSKNAHALQDIYADTGSTDVPAKAKVTTLHPDAEALSGRLILSGAQGNRFPLAQVRGKSHSSVLISLDLASGALRHGWTDMADGHIPIHLTDGRIICCGQYTTTTVVMDKNLNEIKRLTSPAGFTYTGHPLADEKRGVVYVPLKSTKELGDGSEGRIEVLDIHTLEKKTEYPSGAAAPHELRLLPDGTHMAVCHYGEILNFTNQEMQLRNTHLTLINVETRQVVKKIPSGINGMLTHMDIGADGHIYAVLSQFMGYDNIRDVEANIRRADARLKEVLGIDRHWPLSRSMMDDWRYDFPMPILRIDPQSGAVQAIYTDPGYHLRCQSVAANTLAHKVFITGHYSNVLMVYDTQTQTTAAFDGEALGVGSMRGVCPIEGTPYIALAGHTENISIIDARDMSLLRQYEMELYRSTHLIHVTA